MTYPNSAPQVEGLDVEPFQELVADCRRIGVSRSGVPWAKVGDDVEALLDEIERQRAELARQRAERLPYQGLLAKYQEALAELSRLRAEPTAQWQPMETAPIEGKFLVWDGQRIMVMDGHIYSLSILPETPRHLSGHHWTHWQNLPSPPAVPADQKENT